MTETSSSTTIPTPPPVGLNPAHYLPPAFLERCRTTKINQLDKLIRIEHLITFKTTDTIAHAFTQLIRNKILSAPVFDTDQKKYIGFLHTLDILAYIVASLTDPSIRSGTVTVEDIINTEHFNKETVKDVLNVSRKDEWITLSEEETIFDAISKFSNCRLRDAAILNKQGEFVSILTQFRLIQWLAIQPVDEMGDLANKTIDQFKLGYKKVYAMHQSRRAMDVFLAINRFGISSIAIVNDDNKVIGTISVSDLKDMGESAQNFITLWTDATTFINSRDYGGTKPRLVYVTPENTIKDVLGYLNNYGIHRVYTLEKNSRYPMGVISCSDVLDFFSTALRGATKKEPAKA